MVGNQVDTNLKILLNIFEMKKNTFKCFLITENQMYERLVYHEKQVKVINVLGMYRNNSSYLDFLFKIFEQWESTYYVEFRYFFMENNSTDDTRDKILNFVKTRPKSKAILFNAKKDYVNMEDGRNFNRISTLAKLRNKLIDCITPLSEDEWCIFVDSNIYFRYDVLQDIFKHDFSKHPNIGMICVYTQQLLLPELHLKNATEPALMNHFYDTYSFLDNNNRSFYPLCAFEKCPICTKYQTDKTHPRIKQNQEITEVNSCFGGFVLINSDVLNDKRIRWETILYDMYTDKSLCEHYLFCDRLRSVSNKKIVILQNVDRLYRTV